MKIFLALGFWAFCLTTSAQTIEKTYLTTDKDIYHQEDTLWFKGYVFNELNSISDKSIAFHVLLSDENGNKIRDTSWPIVEGLSYGNFITPREEGKYFLNAFSGQMIGVNPELIFTKEIFIRSEIADEIALVANFKNEYFEPNSINEINIHASLSERQVAAGQRFTYEVWSKSEKLYQGGVRTDDDGNASINLEKINNPSSDLTILVSSTDKDLVKPVKVVVPVKVKSEKIDLQFLPEGGHLIQDISNKLAFKAIDNNGLPFDFKGVILNERSQIVDSISTTYLGMGSHYFTPSAQDYSFKIVAPSGIDSIYQLPKTLASGVAISLITLAEIDNKLLRLTPHPNYTGKAVTVSISQYGAEVFLMESTLDHRKFLEIPLIEFYPGVAKITMKDDVGNTIAERLFFANSDEQLKINIETEKEFYLPREQVNVKMTVTDIDDEPVQGNFSFSAIDDTRAHSPNENQPNLMAQILLNSELTGRIPTPNFYFSQDSLATKALDNVMLTHGWRKYNLTSGINPEAMKGKVLHRKNKRKVIANTELSLISLNTLERIQIPVDSAGKFYVDSKYLKDKGDSFLLSTVVREGDEKPNIVVNDSSRIQAINFKKSLINDQKSNAPDYSVYELANKISLDQFQSTLLLNTVTVRGNFDQDNPCGIQDFQFEYPWVTKTAGELDMTNLDIVSLLTQVSTNVRGYGKVKTDKIILPDRPKPRTLSGQVITYPIIHAYDALLSYDEIQNGGNPKRYTTRAYSVSLNCQPIIPDNNASQPGEVPIAFDMKHRSILEAIDFRNLESISMLPQGGGRGGIGPRMINIRTINGHVIYKPQLQKYFTFATTQDSPKEFYKPSYATQKQKDDLLPDLRTTIHWEPNIITDANGQATFSFYNADRPNRIRLTVEGINNTSTFGFAQKDYRVLSLNNSEKDQ